MYPVNDSIANLKDYWEDSTGSNPTSKNVRDYLKRCNLTSYLNTCNPTTFYLRFDARKRHHWVIVCRALQRQKVEFRERNKHLYTQQLTANK